MPVVEHQSKQILLPSQACLF